MMVGLEATQGSGMSSEAAVAEAPPPRLFDTRAPFDLSDELQQRVDKHEVAQTIAELQENGYGYVRQAGTPQFNARLREAILRLSYALVPEDKRDGAGGANMLLDKDPIFEEVILNPKLLAVAEVMCGKGAMISQIAASVRPKGAPSIGLHADQNWTPAPFPLHNQLVTFCWACDTFNEANGSTKVVPKSHLKRRHPTQQETQDEPGAIATVCEAGDCVVWDGSTWHSNYPRNAEGQRVVLHITYSRLALRPVECYDHLDEDWLKDKPYELRVLLGREDFLNTREGAFYHGGKIQRTMDWAKV